MNRTFKIARGFLATIVWLPLHDLSIKTRWSWPYAAQSVLLPYIGDWYFRRDPAWGQRTPAEGER